MSEEEWEEILTETRLIRNDMPRDKRNIAVKSMRALMHVQERPEAVSSTVHVVQAVLPESPPREDIQLRTSGAFGEYGAVNCDVALQHAGVRLGLILSRSPKVDCTSGITSAVAILSSGVTI